jgi:hypothetical protein
MDRKSKDTLKDIGSGRGVLINITTVLLIMFSVPTFASSYRIQCMDTIKREYVRENVIIQLFLFPEDKEGSFSWDPIKPGEWLGNPGSVSTSTDGNLIYLTVSTGLLGRGKSRYKVDLNKFIVESMNSERIYAGCTFLKNYKPILTL